MLAPSTTHGTALFLGCLALASCGDSIEPSGGNGGASGASAAGASSLAGAGGSLLGGGGSTSSGAQAGAELTAGGMISAGGTAFGGAPGGSSASGSAGASGASGGGGVGGSVAARPFKGVANSECADLTTLNVAWWYNWTLSPGSCNKDEFVPMISGKNEKSPSAVAGALQQVVNAGYDTVLGFNEPNKVDQSNLTVAQVADLWPSITSNPDVRVGSPATSADAKAWFQDFMGQVEARSLRVDFVAIHWYGWNAGSCDHVGELESYVEWAEGFGRPIWITEWGCMNQSNPSPEVVESFYAEAAAMFQEHPLIERYAWYPWNTNNHLMEGGSPTSLGATFASAPATR